MSSNRRTTVLRLASATNPYTLLRPVGAETPLEVSMETVAMLGTDGGDTLTTTPLQRRRRVVLVNCTDPVVLVSMARSSLEERLEHNVGLDRRNKATWGVFGESDS